ncbi:MAG TPA: hypothetical protein VGV07_12420 [Devosia sp.]|uniref:hypothetical protein n=1 Tax=Devosia sp. TaxID=1871048 RepID=UPI002DDCFD35|nr:hypothetical protein [Devosia sp.]HEV2516049.1 hypothetical protein [Devosia sp.]
MQQGQLQAILQSVIERAGADFAGLGLLVSDNLDALPVVSLVDGWVQRVEPLDETLTRISRGSHRFHDGFHVVDSDGRLTAVSQYFSPPIVGDLWYPSEIRRGGRYVAGLFGSTLPSVHMTAVASSTYGVMIFVNGREAL